MQGPGLVAHLRKQAATLRASGLSEDGDALEARADRLQRELDESRPAGTRLNLALKAKERAAAAAAELSERLAAARNLVVDLEVAHREATRAACTAALDYAELTARLAGEPRAADEAAADPLPALSLEQLRTVAARFPPDAVRSLLEGLLVQRPEGEGSEGLRPSPGSRAPRASRSSPAGGSRERSARRRPPGGDPGDGASDAPPRERSARRRLPAEDHGTSDAGSAAGPILGEGMSD